MTYGNVDSFAFNLCNTKELINLNFGVSLENTHVIANVDVQFSNLCDKDIDTNLPSKTCCKNFNIFHNNVNVLETKHDILHNFLTNNYMDFDIIAITETSLKTGNNFKTNIDLEGYLSFSIPSNSNKGGSTIYAKSDFNILERTDLNSTSDDYESIWVEIKNEKSKNIICGSVYSHPCNNNDTFNHFLKYLEVSLNKVMKENKEIYLCGDFNIDLLKINEIINHRNFYELE